jgi:hypothetical protein
LFNSKCELKLMIGPFPVLASASELVCALVGCADFPTGISMRLILTFWNRSMAFLHMKV